ACKLCHLNSIASVRPAFYNFTQKYDGIAFFLDCNTVIVDAVDLSFQLGKLMIMSRKERLCPQQSGIADMLHHRPGNRETVKGTRSPSDLVKNQKTFARGITKNIRNLSHLRHKGTLAGCQVIGCPDPRKDPVHQPDIGLGSRNKGADLRHQYNQCGL